jgi:hypothetical protein
VTDIGVERFTPYLRGLAPVASSGTTAGGPVNLMLASATPAQATMRTLISCDSGASASCISNAKGAAFQTISHRVSGTVTSYALDLAATLLPWVSASYLPASTTLDVTVTGTGTYDLFEADLRYIRGQVIYTWRVFGPTAGDITFPTLPSTLPGDPTVRTTDTQSAYHVYLCESDAIAGYRAAIANPYAALGTCESPPSVTTVPYAGTLNRISQSN